MSEEDPLVDGLPLSSLKVVDLRAELKKRGLSANGNKNVLVDRLRNFITTGAAEYSDASSTQSSPVKSPNSSSSLIAQYRASQQQMLAAVGRHDSSENGVENGHTSPQKSPTKGASPTKSPEKAVSPAKSPEKASPAKSSIKEPSPPPKKAESPVKEPSPPPKTKSTPKRPSPPKKAKSPVKEPSPGPPAKKSRKASEPSPKKETPRKKEEDPEVPGISQEREISKEPSEEPERSREPSATAVSGAENDESSETDTPVRPKSPVRAPETSNGSVFAPTSEPTEELDYEEENTTVKAKKPEVYTEGVVYVKSPERPKPSKIEEDPLTDDGFVRRREVTPAKNPQSAIIHVRNLKRPFTLGSLQNVLKKFGEFDAEKEFWIDSIRSHCFVKYASADEASKARDALHYIEWPPGNKTEITADYSNEEEFDHFRGVIKKVIRNESVDDESSRSTKQEEAASPRIREEKADREKRHEEKKSIEQLFRKTKTEPAIYYLPLTEEEAARNQVRKAVERRKASPPAKNANVAHRLVVLQDVRRVP
ncbi:hypothetical protein FO519_008870 [Halicephalobus sp. NKZ332]|nr:hypothetical protein FO519_008870 [Halicephalobus sp. NKZ332]